ncbi:MAG: demethoxyubiquinone hydroxylase family protein [Flavobacteriales bacterium]
MQKETLHHPELADLLRKAYSAEKAASFAYQGHAASVKSEMEKAAIRQIEQDEWNHRAEVLHIMQHYHIKPSWLYEVRFHLVGRTIGTACHVIGWFMPYYFAGRLESGNVCEYFRMIHFFHHLGITEHDQVLYNMGMKEKEHEVYFLGMIKHKKVLLWFEKIFAWGEKRGFNDVDLEQKYSLDEAEKYCRK